MFNSDYILPVENQGGEIYQIKTDSFLTNLKSCKFHLSKDMGGLKIEKEYKGFWRVKNKKEVIDENEII